jgi:serine protease Do
MRWLAEILAGAMVLVTVLAVGQAKADETPLEQAMATVLTVHSADDSDAFLGSAFLWGETAEVAVTNAHVVKDAAEVRLRDAAGNEEIALVIARDEIRDVAVLSVKPGRRGLIPSSAPLGLGAEVWALGAPLGIEFTVTEGTVSALSRQVDPAAPVRMLQHDAAVNPGSSGGPLVDAGGHLVGMNSQIADGSRMFVGIAYAIPAADLGRIVTGLIEETLPPLPRLGLRARAVDRQLSELLGIAPTGLLVDEVEDGGLAEAAGLLPGDIVLAVGGTAIGKPGDLPFALEAAQAAGSADLAVMREGAMILLPLSLEEEEETGNLALRDIGGALPQKVESYTLATLGLTLEGDRITAVQVNSPANFAGLAEGDRILMLDGKPVDAAALAAFTLSSATLFLVGNGSGTRHVVVDPYARSGGIHPVGGANVLDPAVVVF